MYRFSKAIGYSQKKHIINMYNHTIYHQQQQYQQQQQQQTKMLLIHIRSSYNTRPNVD